MYYMYNLPIINFVGAYPNYCRRIEEFKSVYVHIWYRGWHVCVCVHIWYRGWHVCVCVHIWYRGWHVCVCVHIWYTGVSMYVYVYIYGTGVSMYVYVYIYGTGVSMYVYVYIYGTGVGMYVYVYIYGTEVSMYRGWHVCVCAFCLFVPPTHVIISSVFGLQFLTVEEVSMCEYIAVVGTQQLCKLKAFE